ncbi:MAG: thioredoxin domain-containing protein, partial [Clostridium sp.]|nr:thioredoxin domain-containing protein [Clostridium sp.]
LLLRYWKVNNSEKALEMVTRTLDSMYKGGIFDHIGFGFSRYSTDEKWLVPHFEKMLYDNALLAICYLEAYLATGKKLYSEVAEKVFTYILRDMKHTGGGFYSAEDADSEGEEGKFYLWSYEEIISLLGEEKGKLFCNYYDITKRGNFENRNIPNLINTNLDEIEDNKQIKDILEDLSKDLFIYREKRIHPHKDDKILTSWNGLMIAALAYGGKVLKNNSYINEAKEAVRFIYEKLVREDGRLLARYREGEAAYLAYSDDYAFLIWGLIELYEATFDFQYLKKAMDLNNDMYRYFWDKEGEGFFLYGEDSEELIWRPKEIYDGAIPSGNSVAALNILRLGKLTGDLELEERVKKMFKVFGGRVKEIPTAYSYFMIGVLYSNISGKDIVIAGEQNNHDAKTLINEINKSFQPFTTVVLNNGDEELYKIAPTVKEKASIDGKTTIHICENFSCRRPITNIEEAINVLK